MKKRNWNKYLFEFLSIFLAVISAFALNTWNENRKNDITEQSILIEIRNGLDKDIDDFKINIGGHIEGIKACKYWRKVIYNKEVDQDSLFQRYIQLTRDFTSLQNISGYEALKSRGFELVKNDSLRADLIALYEYDYYTLKTFEEGYYEMQYQKNYFKEINNKLAPHFIFRDNGTIEKLDLPVKLTKAERNVLMSYLTKIQFNRFFLKGHYGVIEKKVIDLKERIDVELKL